MNENNALTASRYRTSAGAGLRLAGTLGAENAGSLLERLGEKPLLQELDLDELEIEGRDAALEAVDAVKGLLEEGPLVLRGAPQILAHTLYRVGLLERGRLTLRDTRQEEPYG